MQCVTSHGSRETLHMVNGCGHMCQNAVGAQRPPRGRKHRRLIRTHEGILERSDDVVAAIFGGAWPNPSPHVDLSRCVA